MYRQEIRVLELLNQHSLGCFLECEDRLCTEPDVLVHILGNLAHQALEREFLDQQISGALVLADLLEGG